MVYQMNLKKMELYNMKIIHYVNNNHKEKQERINRLVDIALATLLIGGLIGFMVWYSFNLSLYF